MVARHASTLATITKKNSITKVNNAFSTIQKIATYQIPIPPTPLPVAGGGVSVGSGTSFPVLYPIAELGNNHGTITINLANQNLHYQKMVINAAGVSSVVFSGLLLNKAIVFTLDVTIGVAGVTALNWPANLYNLPTLPITNGSRYVLYISGFKDGSEERYEVVGSSIPSGGGSNLWSNIVIDTNKNMLAFNLTNLGLITFANSDGKTRQINGIIGTGMTFDLPSAESYFFKINSSEIVHIDNTGIIPGVDSASNLGSDSRRFGVGCIEVVQDVNALLFGNVSTTRLIKNTFGLGLYYNVPNPEFHDFRVADVSRIAIAATGIFPAVDITQNAGSDSLRFSTGNFAVLQNINATLYGNSSTHRLIKNTFGSGLYYNVLATEIHSFRVNDLETVNINNQAIMPALDGSINLGTDTKRFGIGCIEVLQDVNAMLFGTVSTTRLIKNTFGNGLYYNVLGGEVHSFRVADAETINITNGGINPTNDGAVNLGSDSKRFGVGCIEVVQDVNAILFGNVSTTRLIQHSTGLLYNVLTSENHVFQINGVNILGVEYDNTNGDTGYVDFHQTHVYTSANSGGGSALPATPVGYLIIGVNGTERKIPYYAL